MSNCLDQEYIIGGLNYLLRASYKDGVSSIFENCILMEKIITNNFSILCKLDISMEEVVKAAFGGNCLEELFTKADLMRAAQASLDYQRSLHIKGLVALLDQP